MNGTYDPRAFTRAGLERRIAKARSDATWIPVNGKPPFAVRLHSDRLAIPLLWRKPRRIFVCSMGDLFHPGVPFEFIAAVYGVMAACPQHTFCALTKRPERMREFDQWVRDDLGRVNDAFRAHGFDWVVLPTQRHGMVPGGWPLRNVWAGVTVKNQERADRRVGELLSIPAAKRFLSIEPMLGPVDRLPLRGRVVEKPWFYGGAEDCDGCAIHEREWRPGIDWVIVGGETGPGARPMHPDWVRSVRDQCVAAGVPFLLKSNGEYEYAGSPWEEETRPLAENERWLNHAGGSGFHGENVVRMRRVGKKAAGRLLDGRTWDEVPR